MIYSDNIHIGTKGISFTDKHGKPLSIGLAIKKAFVRFANWGFDLELVLVHFVSEHIIFSNVRKFMFKLVGLKIGKGSTIHMGVRFFSLRGITIGEDSIVGFGCFLDGREKLSIGNHVDIASEAMIYNSEHDLGSEGFEAKEEKVIINDYVFVGPRAIILPGVSIGKGAVIAAGAVVTKDVENYQIVGGVPAKVIGERVNKDLAYRLGRARLFQ